MQLLILFIRESLHSDFVARGGARRKHVAQGMAFFCQKDVDLAAILLIAHTPHADILNISRPYLIKQLEQNELPFTKVGTHRRMRFDDLMQYKKSREVKRKAGLTELAHINVEERILIFAQKQGR